MTTDKKRIAELEKRITDLESKMIVKPLRMSDLKPAARFLLQGELLRVVRDAAYEVSAAQNPYWRIAFTRLAVDADYCMRLVKTWEEKK